MKNDGSCLERRRFLSGMVGGGVAALGVGAAVPVVQYVGNLRKEPPPDFLVLEPADYELAPDTSKIVMYGPIPALLLQTPEPGSEFRVFVATCTHFDCTVSYRPDMKCIFCACHEGRYDLEGRVTGGPPPRPLDKFFWERKDDKLAIALEKEKLAEAWAEPEETGA